MPFMEGVHDVVGHHVQLGVLDGDEVLFLERLTAPGAVINYTRSAGRLPPHASSSGLVLLAHGPADLRRPGARRAAAPLHAEHSGHRGAAAVVLAEVRRQGSSGSNSPAHRSATPTTPALMGIPARARPDGCLISRRLITAVSTGRQPCHAARSSSRRS
ncbi:IclR family transcriptional regulator domain-containing protein [Streptomyces sp. BRA346]|uniref:IclR family transcriptional regulator domain-containing protein n=1 Tax=Streptomyces sp. BRA346 TaxID=2878199 RepID=UPI00406494F1